MIGIIGHQRAIHFIYFEITKLIEWISLFLLLFWFIFCLCMVIRLLLYDLFWCIIDGFVRQHRTIHFICEIIEIVHICQWYYLFLLCLFLLDLLLWQLFLWDHWLTQFLTFEIIEISHVFACIFFMLLFLSLLYCLWLMLSLRKHRLVKATCLEIKEIIKLHWIILSMRLTIFNMGQIHTNTFQFVKLCILMLLF